MLFRSDIPWWVSFPDVPGALTQGHSLDEALDMAADALSAILVCGRKGKDYGEPSTYDEVVAQAKEGERVFPIMPTEKAMAAYRPKKRIDIMMPRDKVDAIDLLVKGVKGLDRSKFITRAVDYYLAEKYPSAVPAE